MKSIIKAGEILKNLKTACYHYRGDLPCGPHRNAGKTCSCDECFPVKRQWVVIKLGAAGDVIWTTPLLRALDPLRTGTKVLWVKHLPELMPSAACEPVKPSAAVLAQIAATEWDFCWNLDKDIEACAIEWKIC